MKKISPPTSVITVISILAVIFVSALYFSVKPKEFVLAQGTGTKIECKCLGRIIKGDKKDTCRGIIFSCAKN